MQLNEHAQSPIEVGVPLAYIEYNHRGLHVRKTVFTNW